MSNPKISVIVPVYNAEKYLRRCIDSILAQTFTDFELLLIDDGSKDKSGEICDEYARKDNRVRVFHKENGGVSSARNLGLDNAQGEWICFCDADDWVDDNWLYNYSICLNYDIIVQGFYVHRDNETRHKKLSSITNLYFEKEKFFEYLMFLNDIKNVGYVWCRLFNKTLIYENNIRFNEDFTLCEDLEFIFRYLIKSESSYIQNSACYHYVEPNYNQKYYNNQCYRNNLKCFYSIINNYVLLVGNKKSPLIFSLINQYINCLIKIVRTGNNSYDLLNEYTCFIQNQIHKLCCLKELSLKSQVFLFIRMLPNNRISNVVNSIIWKVLKKHH